MLICAGTLNPFISEITTSVGDFVMALLLLGLQDPETPTTKPPASQNEGGIYFFFSVTAFFHCFFMSEKYV